MTIKEIMPKDSVRIHTLLRISYITRGIYEQSSIRDLTNVLIT
jgi:hypothetical protein